MLFIYLTFCVCKILQLKFNQSNQWINESESKWIKWFWIQTNPNVLLYYCLCLMVLIQISSRANKLDSDFDSESVSLNLSESNTFIWGADWFVCWICCFILVGRAISSSLVNHVPEQNHGQNDQYHNYKWQTYYCNTHIDILTLHIDISKTKPQKDKTSYPMPRLLLTHHEYQGDLKQTSFFTKYSLKTKIYANTQYISVFNISIFHALPPHVACCRVMK